MHVEKTIQRLEQLYTQIQSARRQDYYDRLREFVRLCTQTPELAKLLDGLSDAPFDLIRKYGLNLMHWPPIDFSGVEEGIAIRWDALSQIIDTGLTTELATYSAAQNWRDTCTQILLSPVYYYLLDHLNDSIAIPESMSHNKKKDKITFDTAFNSYVKVKILGHGGSGTVYQVADESGKKYALKQLDPQKATTHKRKRFMNELSFCLQEQGKNIIRVLDYGIVTLKGTDSPFYVMPYYPSTLRNLIEEGIPPDEALELFLQIFDGVETAHLRGVWHRDLKPENILYDPDSDLLVVADFGIAHFAEEYLQTFIETKPGDRLANFQYAAPEQRQKGKKVDERADIYALGLILNEMFTGDIRQGPGYITIEQVATDYAFLDEIVESMVQQSPENRPTSIDAVKCQLIARENEFVSRQRLSELKNQVVPRSEIEDPLIDDPPKLVDFNYRQGHLYLILNRPVNSDWMDAFYNLHIRYTDSRMVLRRFVFEDNEVKFTLQLRRSEMQGVIDVFKEYLEKANREYKRRMLEDQHRKEEEERRNLEAKIQEEEMRLWARENVRI